jgi:hypothetical protein
MERTFAKRMFPVGGGGGGGGGGGAVQRAALEQTVGRVYLDRLNGYPTGNVAALFQGLGGTDSTVISTLNKAFGNNFDAVAVKGVAAINDAAKQGLGAALRAEGLTVPITPAFRDLLLNVDPNTTVGAMRANVGKPIDSN